MEHKVGEVITLEVVERENSLCKGCFFYKFSDCYNAVNCSGLRREDGKSIMYKEISRS